MTSRTFHRLTWRISLLAVVCLPWLVVAQQAAKSDADLAQQGALALALAHGDKPRYGGKFLSVGNEEIPFYDMHQTSLGGIYAAVAPAYNCLIRTSPYDPKGQEIMPELADTWEVSDGGKTLTSPVAARAAVAAGYAATTSLRSNGTPIDIPALDPALVEYFDNGQAR